MKDKVIVRCKYAGDMVACDKFLDDNNCIEVFGSNYDCNTSFKLDWVRFILLKNHVIEVK